MFRSTLNNARKGKKNSSNAETMAVFGMISVVILFAPLLLLLAKSISTQNGNIQLPATFHLSTLVILGSSWTLSKAKYFKQQDQIRQYKNMLIVTLALALLFLTFQWTGWLSLVGQYRMEQHAINFIIVLAILHGAHLFFGVVVLVLLVIKAFPLKSGAELYIHFLNPSREVSFRVLFNYWHFVDLLWIFMYIVFVVKLG